MVARGLRRRGASGIGCRARGKPLLRTRKWCFYPRRRMMLDGRKTQKRVMYPTESRTPNPEPPTAASESPTSVLLFDAAALNLIPRLEDAENRVPNGHEKEGKRKVKKKKKGGGRRKRDPGRSAPKKPGHRPATSVSAALAPQCAAR